MQRNATQHVIDRFKEKFYRTIAFKGKEPFELINEDFDIIHKMCKDDSIRYGCIRVLWKKAKQVLIGNTYVGCIYNK